MAYKCTRQKNVQILIALLKEHGIRKIIASPGSMNIPFVGSIQNDSYFEIYSAPDERSAAYIACGMSVESGEPVVLTCTGATASRNYLPGLTEAFYRKIPILAVTAAYHQGEIGQNMPQVIDRSICQNDIAKLSVNIGKIYSAEDEWACTTKINDALLELKRNGCGPVHINIETSYTYDIDDIDLPNVRSIERIFYYSTYPTIKEGARIGIFVGAHRLFSDELTKNIENFCKRYNAVVFCDRTSNYFGNYRILPNLICGQVDYYSSLRKLDLLIHIGDVSGSYSSFDAQEVWRVNPDGQVRDTFRRLTKVFEVEESTFFSAYSELINNENAYNDSFYSEWKNECDRFDSLIPELPFSNAWIAQQVLPLIPDGFILHLGILNTLRVWNNYESNSILPGYCNTGGFGIDGSLSALIGAALASPEKIFICVLGDLAFFYDMNSLGNRHLPHNIRIILINNSGGMEFRNKSHIGYRFGEKTDLFIAAGHHYGNKSQSLVKHYTEDLGFEYYSATSKDEFLDNYKKLLDAASNCPVMFEVFTDDEAERDALDILKHLEVSSKGRMKNMAKTVLGDSGIDKLKRIIHK